MGTHSTRYPAEVRERAVRLVLDHQGGHKLRRDLVPSGRANGRTQKFSLKFYK